MTPLPLNEPEQRCFGLAEQHYEQLVERLISTESQRLDHGELEAIVQQEGTELLRRLLQRPLDLHAAHETLHSDVIGSDGEPRPHRRKQAQRQLTSLLGDVTLARNGYSIKQIGVSALYPEDGKLNLPVDQYSDGIRQRVAIEASKVSFSEPSQTIDQTTGAQVGKRQCEEISVKVAQDFDEFYGQRHLQVESTENLLVITTDGKGIVMHSEDLREATAKAAQKASERRKTRLSPREKGSGWPRWHRCIVRRGMCGTPKILLGSSELTSGKRHLVCDRMDLRALVGGLTGLKLCSKFGL
jgi:hypothetical protein